MDIRIIRISSKYLASTLFIAISIQLQSCGDDDPISAVSCNWNDPFFCENEGNIKLINSSTSRSIVRIYFVKDCSVSWGSAYDVNIGPNSHISFRHLDSGDKYNVKADWSDATCDMKFGIKVPHGGEKRQTLTRDPTFCNINATAC